MLRFEKNDIQRILNCLDFHKCSNWVTHPKSTVNLNCSRITWFYLLACDAMCIFLHHRLCMPQTLFRLEFFFGLSSSFLSRVFHADLNLLHSKVHARILLDRQISKAQRIETYARAIQNKGATTNLCWGFIDGTIRRCSHPSGPQQHQQALYTGRNKAHGYKEAFISIIKDVTFINWYICIEWLWMKTSWRLYVFSFRVGAWVQFPDSVLWWGTINHFFDF